MAFPLDWDISSLWLALRVDVRMCGVVLGRLDSLYFIYLPPLLLFGLQVGMSVPFEMGYWGLVGKCLHLDEVHLHGGASLFVFCHILWSNA